MRRNSRVERISQEIQKRIAVILQNKMDDPRIGIPTISGVCVSKDLKHAKIFITFLNKESLTEIRSAVMVLQRASQFIRFLLAQDVRLRVIPMLFFKYDASLAEGLKICSLVEKAMNHK